ncbi:MAG: hypothetical protein JWQ45_1912 [Blastococcus sp.]|jgi:hypothetical protein|nr:hypothetical protein [Blastococcus sp.]
MVAVAVGLAMLLLTGCGAADGGDTAAGTGTAVLTAADVDLGTRLVDAGGRTVHVFDLGGPPLYPFAGEIWCALSPDGTATPKPASVPHPPAY